MRMHDEIAGKSRDMAVGMMPAKLVQMMINLAMKNGKIDRSQKLLSESINLFSGLGTTPIEAVIWDILISLEAIFC